MNVLMFLNLMFYGTLKNYLKQHFRAFEAVIFYCQQWDCHSAPNDVSVAPRFLSSLQRLIFILWSILAAVCVSLAWLQLKSAVNQMCRGFFLFLFYVLFYFLKEIVSNMLQSCYMTRLHKLFGLN